MMYEKEIFNMATSINNGYQRGVEEGIKIGRQQVWAEIKELLKGGDNESGK